MIPSCMCLFNRTSMINYQVQVPRSCVCFRSVKTMKILFEKEFKLIENVILISLIKDDFRKGSGATLNWKCVFNWKQIV